MEWNRKKIEIEQEKYTDHLSKANVNGENLLMHKYILKRNIVVIQRYPNSHRVMYKVGMKSIQNVIRIKAYELVGFWGRTRLFVFIRLWICHHIISLGIREFNPAAQKCIELKLY